MGDVAHNLTHVRDKISAAAAHCGRSSEEVTSFAASKTKPASAIKETTAARQCVFDEDYVRGEMDKVHYFQEKGIDNLQWRFIGLLQSNRSRLTAKHFDWYHTIDRLRIAARSNEQYPVELPPLNVLIQINVNDESNKSGISLTELDALAAGITALLRITLRGLMAVPAPESDYVRQFEVA